MRLFARATRLLIAQPVDLASLAGLGAALVAAETGGQAVDVLDVSGLDMSFSVTKDLKKNPNDATIKVFGMAPKTRAALQARAASIVLQASYDGAPFATVFRGDVRYAAPEHDGPEWIVTIEAGDGERAQKYGRVSESWRGATGAGRVVRKVVESAGIGTGNLDDHAAALDSKLGYQHGYVAHGLATRELDRVLAAAGYEWSIQDGALQVLRAGQTLEGVVEISPESGLVGSPTLTTGEKKGKPSVLTFKSLLRPDLRPGQMISVLSEQYVGVYRAIKIQHDGDTAGTDWYTTIDGVPA